MKEFTNLSCRNKEPYHVLWIPVRVCDRHWKTEQRFFDGFHRVLQGLIGFRQIF